MKCNLVFGAAGVKCVQYSFPSPLYCFVFISKMRKVLLRLFDGPKKKKSMFNPSAALFPVPPAGTRGPITLQWGLLRQMLHVHPYGMHDARIDVSQTVYIVLGHLCYGRSQLDPFAVRSWRFTRRFARPHVESMLLNNSASFVTAHEQINSGRRRMSVSDP